MTTRVRENWTQRKDATLIQLVQKYIKAENVPEFQQFVDECRSNGIQKATLGAIAYKLGGRKDSILPEIVKQLMLLKGERVRPARLQVHHFGRKFYRLGKKGLLK